MRLRVLGCSGTELPGWNATSFLIDESLLIDAGSVCQVLSLAEQRALQHICITHAHLDHIRGLAPLSDNLALDQTRPKVEIISSGDVIDALRTYLFNDIIWPDFSRLPSPAQPAIAYREIPLMHAESLGAYTVTAIPVDHTVPAVGYLVQSGRSSVLFSGDTGPTRHLWRFANGVDALIVDVSFPDIQEELALLSGHLTPRMLGRELAKVALLPQKILVTHTKPQYLEPLRADLCKLPFSGISLMQDGDLFEF